ncbi:hypothetical protein Tsp_15679 [Trichinella spiralis]|uniref:hypothetical protein n=1 Tax=Trichinella spiralis TaxID=6334 RepID=UPI0001EFEFE1|nr:hypothetical protein Tsp_15679 [Trichinella spiralis]
MWIVSPHEARTDANQCSPGVSIPFSSRPSVPLLITNSKKEFDIITAMKYSQPMALSNSVSYVRNCEDESRILNDLHRITLCCYCSSSITFYNMASSTLALVRSIKCDSVQVKVSMRRNSKLSGVRETAVK